jgi:hypothetical protein
MTIKAAMIALALMRAASSTEVRCTPGSPQVRQHGGACHVSENGARASHQYSVVSWTDVRQLAHSTADAARALWGAGENAAQV